MSWRCLKCSCTIYEHVSGIPFPSHFFINFSMSSPVQIIWFVDSVSIAGESIQKLTNNGCFPREGRERKERRQAKLFQWKQIIKKAFCVLGKTFAPAIRFFHIRGANSFQIKFISADKSSKESHAVQIDTQKRINVCLQLFRFLFNSLKAF